MNNNIHGLRDILFETLRELKSGNLDIDRAKAINDTAQTIINSAKVEVDHLKIAGGSGSGFIDAPAGTNETPTNTGMKMVNGNVTTHRLR